MAARGIPPPRTESPHVAIHLLRRESVSANSHLRPLLLTLALTGAMLVMAAPASATGIPEAGSRINVGAAPATFPADTPFHVTHGFGCGFSDVGCLVTTVSGSLFSLYVDGVLQPSQSVVLSGQEGLTKAWLTNFWDGLSAGRHTLVGVWTQNGVVLQTATATIRFN